MEGEVGADVVLEPGREKFKLNPPTLVPVVPLVPPPVVLFAEESAPLAIPLDEEGVPGAVVVVVTPPTAVALTVEVVELAPTAGGRDGGWVLAVEVLEDPPSRPDTLLLLLTCEKILVS